jgi:hypothetical protein
MKETVNIGDDIICILCMLYNPIFGSLFFQKIDEFPKIKNSKSLLRNITLMDSLRPVSSPRSPKK